MERLACELICPICLDFYQNPVLLNCDHNFCQDCITRCWAEQNTRISCPQCRQEISVGSPRLNRVLSNIVEGFKALGLRMEELTSQSPRNDGCTEEGMICKDDTSPNCLTGAESVTSGSNPFSLVQDASKIYKLKLELSLNALQKEVKAGLDFAKEEEERMKKLKEKADTLKEKIGDEFSKLHYFLEEEEKTLRAKVEEERLKQQKLLKHSRKQALQQVDLLQKVISEMQEKMSHRLLSLLTQDMKDLLHQAQTQFWRPSQLAVDLNEAEFIGPLQYRVWKKMTNIIYPAVSPVTMDHRTAHSCLILSEDLTSVEDSGKEQRVPENLQRFSSAQSVLGAEGFTSGRHYWEVEVGGKTKWDLGVAKESVNRRGTISLCPSSGFWTLVLRDGDQYKACTVPPTNISLNVKPRKIGVYLNYEEGQVSFYNAVTMELIYSFTDMFTEKLFPYFSPCSQDRGKNSQPLKVFVLHL
ncbi:zinc-binding protein A33-like isoform X2 [Protopterus annectens]|uniref:zinc-binding protein A33-like isoform X2 n=1 Tax=Protopterus annectens TaxID=7888 RepID=UPI001CF991DD|nr:zinc-binding protein A33-like isoform X2 [Protopterus annectens]